MEPMTDADLRELEREITGTDRCGRLATCEVSWLIAEVRRLRARITELQSLVDAADAADDPADHHELDGATLAAIAAEPSPAHATPALVAEVAGWARRYRRRMLEWKRRAEVAEARAAGDCPAWPGCPGDPHVPDCPFAPEDDDARGNLAACQDDRDAPA